VCSFRWTYKPEGVTLGEIGEPAANVFLAGVAVLGATEAFWVKVGSASDGAGDGQPSEARQSCQEDGKGGGQEVHGEKRRCSVLR